MDFPTFWLTIIVKNPFGREGPSDFPFLIFSFSLFKKIFLKMKMRKGRAPGQWIFNNFFANYSSEVAKAYPMQKPMQPRNYALRKMLGNPSAP